jgi:PAS domain S-box-containing protein
MSRAAGSAATPGGEAPAQGRGDRVLLVDDDPVLRLLTATALAERGWEVIEAAGGEEALAACAGAPPQVVVLDALMPAPDGFETCARLRRLPGGEHLPVLMLTGLDDEASVTRAYEAGATDFVVKSATQWTLLSERLRYLLRAARMRAELAVSQAKLHKAQRIARLGSWEWDPQAGRIRVSEECRAMAGLAAPDGEIADWQAWSRVAVEDRGRIERLYREHLAGGGAVFTFEAGVVHADGRTRIVRVEAESERDADGRVAGMHGILQDVTERRQAEEQIRRLANYDSLTGLPNRRYQREEFGAAIERARATGARLALLFVDIDRFKHINDTLGHEVGDRVLREVSWRLHATVREGDTVAREHAGEAAGAPRERAENRVARLGGDEFTLLLARLGGIEDVERIVQRVLAALAAPIDCYGHELVVSASIGVALFPQDGDDVDGLLRKADLAMYAAKAKGGNGWRAWSESMNVAVSARWGLEAGLHRAVERRELILHYQPKIDLASGALVGAEALMRWVREGETIPPGDFIRIAEETGLIVPITEWAIDHACAQLAQWRAQGLAPLPVALNISSRHFQRGNLAAPVRAALARWEVPAQCLEIELTETVLMQDLETALPLLQELKQLGLSIAVDDFGTGYSSLAYLRRLPIDVIKIDRSFVQELEHSADSAAIVAAIIAMAGALNLGIVAEGVETRGQMQALLGQGCTRMQGYLFSRPLAAEAYAALARDPAAAPWRAVHGGAR